MKGLSCCLGGKKPDAVQYRLYTYPDKKEIGRIFLEKLETTLSWQSKWRYEDGTRILKASADDMGMILSTIMEIEVGKDQQIQISSNIWHLDKYKLCRVGVAPKSKYYTEPDTIGHMLFDVLLHNIEFYDRYEKYYKVAKSRI